MSEKWRNAPLADSGGTAVLDAPVPKWKSAPLADAGVATMEPPAPSTDPYAPNPDRKPLGVSTSPIEHGLDYLTQIGAGVRGLAGGIARSVGIGDKPGMFDETNQQTVQQAGQPQSTGQSIARMGGEMALGVGAGAAGGGIVGPAAAFTLGSTGEALNQGASVPEAIGRGAVTLGSMAAMGPAGKYVGDFAGKMAGPVAEFVGRQLGAGAAATTTGIIGNGAIDVATGKKDLSDVVKDLQKQGLSEMAFNTALNALFEATHMVANARDAQPAATPDAQPKFDPNNPLATWKDEWLQQVIDGKVQSTINGKKITQADALAELQSRAGQQTIEENYQPQSIPGPIQENGSHPALDEAGRIREYPHQVLGDSDEVIQQKAVAARQWRLDLLSLPDGTVIRSAGLPSVRKTTVGGHPALEEQLSDGSWRPVGVGDHQLTNMERLKIPDAWFSVAAIPATGRLHADMSGGKVIAPVQENGPPPRIQQAAKGGEPIAQSQASVARPADQSAPLVSQGESSPLSTRDSENTSAPQPQSTKSLDTAGNKAPSPNDTAPHTEAEQIWNGLSLADRRRLLHDINPLDTAVNWDRLEPHAKKDFASLDETSQNILANHLREHPPTTSTPPSLPAVEAQGGESTTRRRARIEPGSAMAHSLIQAAAAGRITVKERFAIARGEMAWPTDRLGDRANFESNAQSAAAERLEDHMRDSFTRGGIPIKETLAQFRKIAEQFQDDPQGRIDALTEIDRRMRETGFNLASFMESDRRASTGETRPTKGEYKQLRAKAVELGLSPKGKIQELRERVTSAQTKKPADAPASPSDTRPLDQPETPRQDQGTPASASAHATEFAEGLSPMQKGQAFKQLNKKVRLASGEVVDGFELIEREIRGGATLQKQTVNTKISPKRESELRAEMGMVRKKAMNERAYRDEGAKRITEITGILERGYEPVEEDVLVSPDGSLRTAEQIGASGIKYAKHVIARGETSASPNLTGEGKGKEVWQMSWSEWKNPPFRAEYESLLTKEMGQGKSVTDAMAAISPAFFAAHPELDRSTFHLRRNGASQFPFIKAAIDRGEHIPPEVYADRANIRKLVEAARATEEPIHDTPEVQPDTGKASKSEPQEARPFVPERTQRERRISKIVESVATNSDPSTPQGAQRILNVYARQYERANAVKGPRQISDAPTLHLSRETMARVQQAFRTTDEVARKKMELVGEVPLEVGSSSDPSRVTSSAKVWAVKGKEKEVAALVAKMERLPKQSNTVKGFGPTGPPASTKMPKPAKTANELAKAISPALAKEASRYAIRDAYVKGNELIVTDGRRLWIARGEWKKKDGLYSIAKDGALSKAQDEGSFPPYKDVIPEATDATRVGKDIEIEPLLWALNQAKVMTADESKGVAVVRNRDGSLGFVTHLPDVGQAEINVEEGADYLFSVNPQFMIEALRFHATSGGGETSVDMWHAGGANKPVMMITGKGTDHQALTVTMPVNADEHVTHIVREITNPKPPKATTTAAIGKDKGPKTKRPKQAMGAAAMDELTPEAKGRKFGKALSEITDTAKQSSKAFVARLAGRAAPKTSTASEESGNALVRYASAEIAAKPTARAMAAQVLGGKFRDAAFADRFGSVLVEGRLRAIRKSFEEAADKAAEEDADLDEPSERAAKLRANAENVGSLVGTDQFPTEADYQKARQDPEIVAARERHNGIVQPFAQEMHEELRGRMAGFDEDGSFVNLLPIGPDDAGYPKAFRSGQGNLSNPRKRKSVHNIRATGSAAAYNVHYGDLVENSISENMKRVALRRMYDQLESDGLAVIAPEGEEFESPQGVPSKVPYIDGKPGRLIKGVEDIAKPIFSAGENVGSRIERKQIWVRRDVYSEVRNALNVDEGFKEAALARVANIATRLQVIGPTDFLYHSVNILSSIAASPGGRNFFTEMVRRTPGVNLIDSLVRVGHKAYSIYKDSPEIRQQIAELSQIGSGRGDPHGTMTGKMLGVIDQAGRLSRDGLYASLVKRGLAKNNEASRRDFINKMGQYNARLMPVLDRRMKETGISPFIVAGKTFNRLSLESISPTPGVKPASASAAAKLIAAKMGGLALAVTISAIINYMTQKKPWGRDGVPIGAIDLGGTDDQGNPTYIDPLKWILVRRGLRISGISRIIEGIQAGQGAAETADQAMGDIFRSLIHPYAGPGANALSVLLTGYNAGMFKEVDAVAPGKSQFAANAIQSLKDVNPTVGAAFKGYGESGIVGSITKPFTSLGGAAGVGSHKALNPDAVRGAKLNEFVDDLAGKARKLPVFKQREFIVDGLKDLPPQDRARAMLKLRMKGLLRSSGVPGGGGPKPASGPPGPKMGP